MEAKSSIKYFTADRTAVGSAQLNQSRDSILRIRTLKNKF